MGNSLGMCAGDRRRSYNFEDVSGGAAANGEAKQRLEHQKQHRAESEQSGDAPDDGYEARMQIDDEELAARYRHCMQLDRSRRKSTASMRRRQSCGSRGARVVTFRAESFDSQVSTESERRNFIMLLIDSLPETFLDEREHPPAPTTLQVSAQVNHYEVDEVEETDKVFAASTSSGQAGAMLSNSVQSHTYESIKSMESEAPRTSPPPPPPSPPPSGRAGKATAKKETRKRSTGKVRQLNGESHTRDSKLTADAQRT